MILIVSICIVMVFSTVALVMAFANGNSVAAGDNSSIGDVITKKETALKIGRALLEEHFPDTFFDKEEPIDAEEKDGIWKVYNVVERGGIREDGTIWDVVGGELYVEFLKSNGEVLKIGVND